MGYYLILFDKPRYVIYIPVYLDLHEQLSQSLKHKILIIEHIFMCYLIETIYLGSKLLTDKYNYCDFVYHL